MEKESIQEATGPIQIDLSAILKSRKGTRRIPAFAVSWLKRLIRQDELNAMLAAAYPRRGAAFCCAVLDHLGIAVNVRHAERLPEVNRRVVYASNHPLGGLDGMALIDWVTRRHGVEPQFIVNDLLMAVEPLSDVFLPINKHGSQSRKALEDIDAAMASDRPVVIFPAGLCSRRRGGQVADLEWQKMFVMKARKFGRDIVPIHFAGRNSSFFYRFARLRELSGIKFNVEMALLPGELVKARGSRFDIICGNPVDPHSLPAEPREAAALLRSRVISMGRE